MHRLLLACLLCSTSAWAARTPFQARCEDTLGATVTTLAARDAGYSINNTLSIKALTRIKSPDRPGSVVLGLTRTEARIAIAVQAKILGDPLSGQECLAPNIEVTLSYVPIVIYVGSEFKPATCAYGEVLAHEMRHLNAYLDHLPKVEAVLRAALKQRFAGQPIYAPGGQGKTLLAREIDTGWLPYIKQRMAEVERLQAAIDSPQEYARLSKVCQGEVQFRIGSQKAQQKISP